MWLLDVNLPTGLVGVLGSYGIACETTVGRGWRDLTNGMLVATAFQAGFRVFLTRDRLFREDASKSLRTSPEIAIVVVTLPQARAAPYLSAFTDRWRERSIQPEAGRVIEWPTM